MANKQKSVYLDNSATTYPKPKAVREAVAQSLIMLGANPGRSGYKMAVETSVAVYNVRKKVADFFGAEGAENVVFTKNCTEALNTVIFGTLSPGDHAVISDLEHNAVLRPMRELERRGVELTVFETYPGDSDRTLDSLRKALKENTRLVVCTLASNVFGTRLPVARLGALCHIYGVDFCVDAAGGAGVIPINMEGESIDYLCVPSHKGLYGIMGAGMLICKKTPRPLTYGGTGTNSISPWLPDELPERLESGTLNVPGIMSVGAGIDFIRSVGIEKLWADETHKLASVYTRLDGIKKIKLYTGMPSFDLQTPVLSFNIEGMNCEEAGERLAAVGVAVRSGLHCAPLAHNKYNTMDGTVRISPSVFTTAEGLDYFVKQIELIVK